MWEHLRRLQCACHVELDRVTQAVTLEARALKNSNIRVIVCVIVGGVMEANQGQVDSTSPCRSGSNSGRLQDTTMCLKLL